VSESPQLEDGYIRIANKLYEEIILFPFSKRELLVVLAVIRKTYGYGKKDDDMTMTQLSKLTGIQRTHIGETVSELHDKNVLLIRDGYHGKVIGLSKNYKNWKRRPKTVHRPKTVTAPSQNGNSTVPKQDADVPKTVHTINNPKRQLQKTTTKDSSSGQTAPTWKAYKDAYFIRYGVDPVRNAKVNGQIAQFIKRVPANEAPHIASHYVKQNGFYADRMHPVDFMLKDAEKLRTEWATGKTAGRKDGYTEFLQDPARGAI
jgi:phage replication O-like protein O